MRVLVTRPLEDAKGTAERLLKLGHTPIVSPLLEIRFRDGAPLSLAGVQAVIATSANGVRALIRRTGRRDLPVFAVGAQTAAAAREAGFRDVKNSDGDSAALADAIPAWAKPDGGILFHAAGNETAGKLFERLRAHGFQMRRDVLYDVLPAESLSRGAVEAMGAGRLDAVLLYSPRSAENFSRCVRAAGLTEMCRNLMAVCISEAAANKCSDLPLREIRVGDRPSEDAMFEALRR
jgi:uroporphyrinogen-III synthase